MTRWGDNFNRADTALGLGQIPGGGPSWQPLIGSWRIFQNRAYIADAPNNGLVVADFGEPSFEITLYASGGDAIYARVSDIYNWVRCRVDKRRTWAGEYQHDITIEHSVNGAVTELTSRILGPRTPYGGWLRFRGKGTSLSAYTASTINGFGSTPVVSTNSNVNLNAPFHGFGRGPSEVSDDYWIDNFTWDSLNTAPVAPTLLHPANGATVDQYGQLLHKWRFNDADPGDHQSRFELRWRPAGSSSWTLFYEVNTPTEAFTATPGSFAEGTWEWQVRTADSEGLFSPWSASSFFTSASVNSPTIMAPASGTVVDRDSVQVTWSAAEQAYYEVRTVPPDAVFPDSEPNVTATPYYSSGVVASSATRSHTVPLPENSRTEWILVRTGVGTAPEIVWSDWGATRVDVLYTPPRIPAMRIDPHDATGTITVRAFHPTPSTGEPSVSSIRLHRRPVGDDGTGDVVPAGYMPTTLDAAPNAAIVDYLPASGVEYEYRVEVRGSNESTAFTDWLTGLAGFNTYGTATFGSSTYAVSDQRAPSQPTQPPPATGGDVFTDTFTDTF